MCSHDMHAHCDVTRFAYGVNHVTMTSPAFVFHSFHIGMRWHDVIGVCIGGTPHHDGLHHMGMTDIGMTSSCSHHIDGIITEIHPS